MAETRKTTHFPSVGFIPAFAFYRRFGIVVAEPSNEPRAPLGRIVSILPDVSTRGKKKRGLFLSEQTTPPL